MLERGRKGVVLDRIMSDWPDYAGRAIEPLARDAIERLLPDPRFGDALFYGAYWNRVGDVEVDLIGVADTDRIDRLAFAGSIKWRQRQSFDRRAFQSLAATAARVPGFGATTLLVGVSKAGFTAPDLDIALGPSDLLAASCGSPEVVPEAPT
ncbi:MAG TPA: DUF234 domain-containing protein [Candidatus Dormibacteraeota bacterium]|nr:DUF234 domain-containing protein [Candidatus Dormibacteraeota bacterium]